MCKTLKKKKKKKKNFLLNIKFKSLTQKFKILFERRAKS